MTDRFTCSICGEEHDGLLTDWAYKLPDEVWALSECTRAEKARFTDDLCQFDERNFIRCVLDVPFQDSSGSFGWGAWVEVDWPTFERYLELFDEDGSWEPAHAGTLANNLPAYPGSLGTAVTIELRVPTKRPGLSLKPEDESRLAVEQRGGIDVTRYHEILGAIARHYLLQT